MGRYFSQSDIQAQMSADEFVRVFDKEGNGDAPTIANFVDSCIARAENRIDMRLGAYVGGVYLNANGAVVDPVIISIGVDFACWYAVRRNPSAQGEKDSPFLRDFKQGEEELKALANDEYFRARTSSGFPTLPQPSIDNVTQPDGVTPNNPWNQAASGQSPSRW